MSAIFSLSQLGFAVFVCCSICLTYFNWSTRNQLNRFSNWKPYYLKRSEDDIISPLHENATKIVRQYEGIQVKHDVLSKVESELMFMEHMLVEYLSKSHPGYSRESENLKDTMLSRLNFVQNMVESLENNTSTSKQSRSRAYGKFIQKRIYELQNPANCEEAKKLICVTSLSCGFGCILHHLCPCMMLGLATNRTVILRVYSRYDIHLYNLVRPISDTCQKVNTDNAVKWDGLPGMNISPHKVVLYKLIPGPLNPDIIMGPHLHFQDIIHQIEMFHGDPDLWFHGQIVGYLMRPQKTLAKKIKHHQKNIGFVRPIVGLHVRRTDKTDQISHSDEEYMRPAIIWYDKYQQKLELLGETLDERRLYVATDDLEAVEVLIKKYPSYTFITNSETTDTAQVSARKTEDAVSGLISDIILMSKCDYLVGGFSSNVFRLAVELMQTRYDDASLRYFTVDWPYHLSFGEEVGAGADMEVVLDHQPVLGSDEVALKRGEIVTRFYLMYRDMRKRRKDESERLKYGYWLVQNKNTSEVGWCPSHKVKLLTSVREISAFDQEFEFT